MSDKKHWEGIYEHKSSKEVSWYRPHLDVSLDLIHETGLNRDARLIDVGGGASTLVDDLLDLGYANVTVLDISTAALEVAKARLGADQQRPHGLRRASLITSSTRIHMTFGMIAQCFIF